MRLKSTAAALLLIAAAAWLVGCADAPSTGPTPPEFVAQYRFIHAASDLGDVGVSVDGAAVGSVAYQGATPHVQFPAGARVAALSNGDTLRVAMQPDRRGSVVLLGRIGQARDYINLTERRVFDPTTTTQAWVRIVSAANVPDGLDVTLAGVDTTIAQTAVALRDDSGYLRVPVGAYTLSVVATGDTSATVLASTTINAANKRQTSVILGSTAAANVGIVNLSDD